MTPELRTRGSSIPRLESGDRLDAAEFERRYEAMGPAVKKAELIDGVVYLAPPVGPDHGRPHAAIVIWLGMYSIAMPGVTIYNDVTLRFDSRSVAQPDALLALDPRAGGILRTDDDGLLRGPVELVVEVAASSASYDLNDKLAVYKSHGVREYVVHVVHANELHWFVLRDGEYVALEPDARGVLRSTVFPGLWLDRTALVGGDGVRVLATLQRGLRSKVHRAFAAKTRAALARKRR